MRLPRLCSLDHPVAVGAFTEVVLGGDPEPVPVRPVRYPGSSV